jgi:hypothetical protein
MFKKSFILGSLLLVSQDLLASTEEALILNQELNFLEESANQVRIIGDIENISTINEDQTVDDDLERKYFETEVRDSVNSKAAAPAKKRSF